MSDYDFVVLGAGSAGCVVANVISQAGIGKVLLVEAGRVPVGRPVHTPALYPSTFRSHWDSGTETVAQPHLRGRRIYWPRGKAIGGSSVINAMIYTRGHPNDFLDWPINHHDNWSANCINAAFLKNEKTLGLICKKDIASDQWLHPLSQAFLASCRQKNWPVVDSLGIFSKLAFGPYVTTHRQRRRMHAHQAFIRPLLETPVSLSSRNKHLSIMTDATIDRIEFDLDRAIGVHLVVNNQAEFVSARKKVILCAGTVQSPAILMRSGIGPRDILSKASVAIRHAKEELGEHLQDHLIFPVVKQMKAFTSLTNRFSASERFEYIACRSGPLSSIIADVGGFVRLSDCDLTDAAHSAPDDPPDAQIHFTPTHYLEYPFNDRQTNACSVGVTLLRPKSRGNISIATKYHATPPVIDPLYLADNSDVEQMIRLIRYGRKCFEYTELGRHAIAELIPGDKRQSDEQLLRSLQAYATTLYHPVGTCRIGADDEAIVGPDFRLLGTDNVYVSDASIIPVLPRGNTQAVAMLVGRLCAQSILK